MNWYWPSETVLIESPLSIMETFVPGAKPITPESVFKDARWSRKYVPSGARRGCLTTTERAGVGFTPRGCAASPLAGLGRVGLGKRAMGVGKSFACRPVSYLSRSTKEITKGYERARLPHSGYSLPLTKHGVGFSRIELPFRPRWKR